VLISQDTRDQITDELTIASQMEVALKGSKSHVNVYEVSGIHGKYAVSCPRRSAVLLPLDPTIEISFVQLDGISIPTDWSQGRMRSAGTTGCVVESGELPAPFSTIHLNFAARDERLGSGAYGKVIATDAARSAFTIEFTTMAPEAMHFLENLVAHRPPASAADAA
jgi:hypothetical protein